MSGKLAVPSVSVGGSTASPASPLRQILAALFTLIGSLDGLLLAATFIEQNLLLIGGLIVIVIAMIAIAWLLIHMPRFVLIICLVSVIVAALPLWMWVVNMEVKPVDVAITQPTLNSDVTMEYTVQGTVSDPSAKVYVLVHPLKTRETWVQQLPLVGRDGSWQTTVFFGTSVLGIDEPYEVIALATKENSVVNFATGNNLKADQVLQQLPDHTNKSKVITVRRPK
jgi:hypothetical protein